MISTTLGYVLPNIISREATQHAATLLYTIFGIRLLWIAWTTGAQQSNQVCRAAATRLVPAGTAPLRVPPVRAALPSSIQHHARTIAHAAHGSG